MKLILAVLVVISIFTFPAQAGDRVITIPKLRFVHRPKYTLNSSSKSGNIISLVIWLTRSDSDSRALTGRLSLLPGTDGTAETGMVTGIYLSPGCVTAATASTADVTLSTKSSVDFTIPAQNSAKIVVGSVHLADSVNLATTSFQPVIEIKINESYGAVVGSISPKPDHINGLGSCVSSAYSTYQSSSWSQNNQSGTVTYDTSTPPRINLISMRGLDNQEFSYGSIQILGGRPF